MSKIFFKEKLEETLKKANTGYTSENFLRIVVMGCTFISIMITGIAFFLRFRRTFPIIFLPIIFLVSFLVIFFLLMLIPSFSVKNRKAYLESDLLYSARHLLLKLESGSSLMNSIESASSLKTKSSRFFKQILYDVSLGMTIESAIDKAIEYSPSKAYTRLLEEIKSSLKTGIDLEKTISSTLHDITKQHLIQIEEYGKKLNPMSMFYMIIGAILPSLGTAMLVVASSFLSSSIIIDYRIFIALGFLLLVTQMFFILAFKSLKPSVME